MARSVLIIDDEQAICQSLAGALRDEGYRVETALSGAEGLEKLKHIDVSIVLLDIWMPGMDGLATLEALRLAVPQQCVLIMSGHGTIETAVRAMKLGAYDFIEKPLSLERLLVLMQRALQTEELARENQALRRQVSRNHRSRVMVGSSEAMKHLRALIARVAPTTGSVLITGENGTGKELVAHALHALSLRYAGPFIEVNCAAIPEELIESELFGHEKGAFTGAVQLHRGKFDLAHGGTLFLDEIGDMSLKTQAKILRILQEQKFERLGGGQSISVDVRIVAATNKDLHQAMRDGQFREDLYYRLNVIPFTVVPLRDRASDIPELVAYFMKECSAEHGRQNRALTLDAMDILQAMPWPGNVRELRNCVERLVILAADSAEALGAQELSQYLPGIPQVDSQSRTLRDARSEFERSLIVKALREHDWNVSKAAQALAIERTHLHRKMKLFGIEVP